jgi:hypothetical protein
MAAVVVLGTYSLVHQTFNWKERPLLGVVVAVHASPESVIDPQLALWLELLPAAVLFYGLLRLAQMMSACERGEIFSSRVSMHLQAFSAAIVVVELLNITLPLQIAALRFVLGERTPMSISQFRADNSGLCCWLRCSWYSRRSLRKPHA